MPEGNTESFLAKPNLKWGAVQVNKKLPLSVKISLWQRWRWIGHVLQRHSNNIARTALTWVPEGRPPITWRRSVERERNEMGWQSWGTMIAPAKDRDGWRAFLNGLSCPAEHEWWMNLNIKLAINSAVRNKIFFSYMYNQSFRDIRVSQILVPEL